MTNTNIKMSKLNIINNIPPNISMYDIIKYVSMKNHVIFRQIYLVAELNHKSDIRSMNRIQGWESLSGCLHTTILSVTGQ
jgi:hypothetical protein